MWSTILYILAKTLSEKGGVRMIENTQIQVKKLTWQLGKEKKILDNICMTFLAGGFYGILGPNGSGKTSLVRHLLRLLEAKQGEVSLNQQNLAQIKRKEIARNIALVPQNTNIETNFTAYDVVMMGRAPYQKRFEEMSQQDMQIVKEAMDLMNCYHLRDQIYSSLSGGEAQRVIAARAIAQQTPWLILDEPIAHLDIRYQVELMEHLRQLNEERKVSILAVLHDINLSAAYCKEIVLMKDAKIIAYGKVEDVLTVKNLEKAYGMEFITCKPEGYEHSVFIAKGRSNLS